MLLFISSFFIIDSLSNAMLALKQKRFAIGMGFYSANREKNKKNVSYGSTV